MNNEGPRDDRGKVLLDMVSKRDTADVPRAPPKNAGTSQTKLAGLGWIALPPGPRPPKPLALFGAD
eukprot:2068531-Pyramimonas_sp.AAC.1